MKESAPLGAPDIPTTAKRAFRAWSPTPTTSRSRRRTPGSVVTCLNGAITKVMADPAFIETLVKLGVDPIKDSSPDKAAAMIEASSRNGRP